MPIAESLLSFLNLEVEDFALLERYRDTLCQKTDEFAADFYDHLPKRPDTAEALARLTGESSCLRYVFLPPV